MKEDKTCGRNSLKKDIKRFITPSTSQNNKLDVDIIHLNEEQLSEYKDIDIYSDSLLFILVLNGSTILDINFKECNIEAQSIILLFQGHSLRARHFSKDFECQILYIGKDYINEMYSTEMLYMRTKYNIKLYNLPELSLSDNQMDILKKRMSLIENEIKNVTHSYQKKLILHTIRIFFLELASYIEAKEDKSVNDRKLTRDEIYFQSFIDLLVNNYQKEHLVDFYANALNITPHYLTLIVKRLTGQTVSDIIFQLIFSEAKSLLQNPNISIQQIAEQLHFSDQSAFGKFFKRKSGISPRSYRETVLRNNLT